MKWEEARLWEAEGRGELVNRKAFPGLINLPAPQGTVPKERFNLGISRQTPALVEGKSFC